MAHPAYAELHCHSHFSFLDGASAPDDLVARAVELGLAGLAVTDHQGLYGAVRFSTAAEAAGLHPVIGVEIELVDAAVPDPGGIVVPARRPWRPGRRPAGRRRAAGRRGGPARTTAPVTRARLPGHRAVVKEDHRGIGEGQRGPHLVLLARDATGWRSLCRMVSRANLAGTKAVPRFTQALLAEHAEGLIALSGCREGELARRLRAGDRDGARAVAERYADVFGRGDSAAGSGFVLELSHHLLPDDDWLVSETARLADELGLPVVVTNDVHYDRPEGRELQDVLTAIRHGRSLPELLDLRRPDGESYLKGVDELLALPPGEPATADADPVLARAWREGIAASAEIAAGCRVELAFERYRFPGFDVPKGETPFSHLSSLCWEGAKRRYHPFTPAVVRQLAHELDVIEKTGLAEFFLICWDLMRFAKSRHIPAQGRGSAADSIVAYVLGITRVDPIRHELLFERFINEGRTAYPDVDIDFSLGAAGGGDPVRLRALRDRAHGDGLQPRHVPGAVGGARGGLRAGLPAAAGGPGGEGARDVRQRDGPAGPRGRGRVRAVLRAAGGGDPARAAGPRRDRVPRRRARPDRRDGPAQPPARRPVRGCRLRGRPTVPTPPIPARLRLGEWHRGFRPDPARIPPQAYGADSGQRTATMRRVLHTGVSGPGRRASPHRRDRRRCAGAGSAGSGATRRTGGCGTRLGGSRRARIPPRAVRAGHSRRFRRRHRPGRWMDPIRADSAADRRLAPRRAVSARWAGAGDRATTRVAPATPR